MSERIKMNTAGEPETDPVSESADTGEDMQTEKNMAGPYEIIVLDLDGTLTNRDKVITPRTKAALMKAQERGKKVVLASGRPTQGVMPLAKELRLEEYSGYILSFNGGLSTARPGRRCLRDPFRCPQIKRSSDLRRKIRWIS